MQHSSAHAGGSARQAGAERQEPGSRGGTRSCLGSHRAHRGPGSGGVAGAEPLADPDGVLGPAPWDRPGLPAGPRLAGGLLRDSARANRALGRLAPSPPGLHRSVPLRRQREGRDAPRGGSQVPGTTHGSWRTCALCGPGVRGHVPENSAALSFASAETLNAGNWAECHLVPFRLRFSPSSWQLGPYSLNQSVWAMHSHEGGAWCALYE